MNTAARWAAGPGLDGGDGGELGGLRPTWRATGAAWVEICWIIASSWAIHSLPRAGARGALSLPAAHR